MPAPAFSQDGLRVAIGLPSAVILVMGGIVGVGIFVNPAVVARSLHTPGLIMAAWVLGGAIALLGAGIYAELAARLPATGGEYVYLRHCYGPMAGFLFGWATLLVVQAGGMAAVAIIFAKNLDVLAGGALPEPAVVVATLALLAWINSRGVQAGNATQAVLGAVKFAGIAALILAGLALAPHAAAPSPLPANAATLKTFGAAMIPVMFSYGGWQTANYVAGEMRNPARNLARALVLGVMAVIALYLLVNLACLRALGTVSLAATLTPAADVLARAAGGVGARSAALLIALSALAFLSNSMLTGPRVIFTMARDGLFFRRLAQLDGTSRVPVGAIMLLAGWTGVLALTGSYEQILSYVIAMNFLFFGLSASCLFILRWQDPAGARHAWGHPFTTALFIQACAAIVACSFWAYPGRSLVGYAILALCVPPYLFWRRQARAEHSQPP